MKFIKGWMATMLLSVAMTAAGQGPNDTKTYYQAADGKKGAALKTALHGIVKSHTDVGYDGLYTVYARSDVRPDGTLRDWYSNITKYRLGSSQQNAAYQKEGDGFNREHTVPQSWFDKASPMKSDAYHVVPSDGYVNNRRGSYPFGEVGSITYQSANGYSKLGASRTDGYTGTVFEPNDEVKGDIARGYFYMVTCYEDKVSGWNGGTASTVFAGNKYPALTSWTLQMMLRWAKQDPVDDVERARNEAVSSFQHNRNPFIDYPGLEQFVWGDSVNVAFSYDHYQEGAVNPDDPVTPDDPDDPVIPDNPDDPVTPAEGTRVYEKITDATDLETGYGYLVVYEHAEAKALGPDSKTSRPYRLGTGVTVSGTTITTDNDDVREIVLGGTSGAYTLYDATEQVYLCMTASNNALYSQESVDENARWTISFDGGNAVIVSNGQPDRTIYYNSDAPRFACYKAASAQQPVALYKNKIPNAIKGVKTVVKRQGGVYSLDGRYMGTSLDKLPRGIYVTDGKKVVK